jgi:photosystem II stability/assembly factor-like uncharacterized protein
VGTNSGLVFRSSDAGETWTEATNGLARSYVNSLVVSPQGELFAGIDYYGVFRSSNHGDLWQQINIGLQAVEIDQLVVNSSGHIFAQRPEDLYCSTDGGESWVSLNTGILSALALSNDGRLFIGRSGEGILRSTDNGGSWTNVYSSAAGGGSFAFGNPSVVFATTGGEGLIRSTDSGSTWKQLNLGVISVFDVATMPGGYVFALTSGKGVMRSSDNGETWMQVNTGLPSLFVSSLTSGPGDILFIGRTSLEGGLFRSTNRGDLWTMIDSSLEAGSIAFNSRGHVFAAMQRLQTYEGVFRSTDSGESWEKVSSGLLVPTVYSLASGPGDFLYAGTGSGVFTSAEPTVNIHGIGNTLPVKCVLDQNYPNPFNLGTIITFDLPRSSQVSLTVYDMLGRKVSVLINDRREGGVHEVKFDMSNIASGVYFYRIQAEDFIATKKMMLIK